MNSHTGQTPKFFRKQIIASLMANVNETNCENFCAEIVQTIEAKLATLPNFDEQRVFIIYALKQIKEAAMISRYNFNHQKPQMQIRMLEMLENLKQCIEKNFLYLIQPNLLASKP